ncbi:MAG: AMP-binding protein [Actinomycetota bacterium]|nr:AMP-binding protein [Actinomycetota bacterium]
MIKKAVARAGAASVGARVLTRSGVIRPISPVKLARLGLAVSRWGTGPAGGFQALAIRWPDKPGLVDEIGTLTFGEMHARSNALARALREQGIGEGDSIAVMCRNHRYFVDVTVAAAKLGADLLYLNTAFAGPQLVEVLEREGPAAVVHDEEFTKLLANAATERRILAWTDSDVHETTIEALIAAASRDDLEPPERHSRVVILTSGTTGTPKGAPRNEAGIDAAVALLDRIPLRAGTRVHIAAPLFHTWGFAHLALGMLLGTTAVLKRRFEPEGTLEVIEKERCEAVIVIPVMLQRIMALPRETLDAHDLATVRVVSSSGSALPGDLAVTWMDTFGDNLYSTYGSTEVAYGSIATPADLRRSPMTAGKPPIGTKVKIFDPKGKELPEGESGRIFVGNSLLFEGYTGGGNKDMIDGLMSTGDVGRLEEGLLYVEGRDDEMIVSGGENVFPKEVEDCLARHDAVTEVAAIGIDDDEFGKRLRAFVVLSDTSCTEDDLKTWVKDNLARYKVPREIVFIDELPRNSTGKVLKRELVERDAQ